MKGKTGINAVKTGFFNIFTQWKKTIQMAFIDTIFFVTAGFIQGGFVPKAREYFESAMIKAAEAGTTREITKISQLFSNSGTELAITITIMIIYGISLLLIYTIMHGYNWSIVLGKKKYIKEFFKINLKLLPLFLIYEVCALIGTYQSLKEGGSMIWVANITGIILLIAMIISYSIIPKRGAIKELIAKKFDWTSLLISFLAITLIVDTIIIKFQMYSNIFGIIFGLIMILILFSWIRYSAIEVGQC